MAAHVALATLAKKAGARALAAAGNKTADKVTGDKHGHGAVKIIGALVLVVLVLVWLVSSAPVLLWNVVGEAIALPTTTDTTLVSIENTTLSSLTQTQIAWFKQGSAELEEYAKKTWDSGTGEDIYKVASWQYLCALDAALSDNNLDEVINNESYYQESIHKLTLNAIPVTKSKIETRRETVTEEVPYESSVTTEAIEIIAYDELPTNSETDSYTFLYEVTQTKLVDPHDYDLFSWLGLGGGFFEWLTNTSQYLSVADSAAYLHTHTEQVIEYRLETHEKEVNYAISYTTWYVTYLPIKEVFEGQETLIDYASKAELANSFYRAICALTDDNDNYVFNYERFLKVITGETANVTYVDQAIEIALDDSHGYDQGWTSYDDEGNKKWPGISRHGKPDYDCSSFVYYSMLAAGYTKEQLGESCWYSGSIGATLKSIGFEEYIFNPLLGSTQLEEGDILVYHHEGTNGHVELYIGDGYTVGAHNDFDGLPGDSSGNEIAIEKFYDYGYMWFYRQQV